MTNTFAQYEQTNQNVPSLGSLCWYSMTTDLTVEAEAFNYISAVAFENVPDIELAVPSPRPVDVFKRACKSVEGKHQFSSQPGVKYNVMIRSAGQTDEDVYRTLVVEQLDTAGHRLNYWEITRFTYNRVSNQVTWKTEDAILSLGGDMITQLNTLIGSVKKYFDREKSAVTSYVIRTAVTNLLERQFKSIMVRPSGGIYFVGQEHVEGLEALEATMNAIGAYFHSMPLVDTGKQRELLRSAFESESVGECDKIMNEMAEIIREGKKITPDRFGGFKAKYDVLVNKVYDYSTLLDEALDETGTRLAMMNETLMSLTDNVDVKDD